jgi:hypothetical protein
MHPKIKIIVGIKEKKYDHNGRDFFPLWFMFGHENANTFRD